VRAPQGEACAISAVCSLSSVARGSGDATNRRAAGGTFSRIGVGLAVLLLTLANCLLAAQPAGDAGRGKTLFEKRCTGCHALDRIKEGPRLRGVYGRHAGSDPSFPYSESLRKARFSWDEPTLQRWLSDPESVVPDTDMAFRLQNEGERADIIAYLKELSTARGK
jgi:cytochrome c